MSAEAQPLTDALRRTLADLAAETATNADRLRVLSALPKVTRDDLLARENLERRGAQIVEERSRVEAALALQQAAEMDSVRRADGVRTVSGESIIPGPMEARSTVFLEYMDGPQPIPRGSRCRPLAGLGVLFALADSPRSEALPMLSVRPDHPVKTARLIERPTSLGHLASSSVLLHVEGDSVVRVPSRAGGGSVKAMRLVTGAAGLLGLLVEARDQTLFVPASNLAYATLDAGEMPGVHVVSVSGWRRVSLHRGTAVERWPIGGEPLPPQRVLNIEARADYLIDIGGGKRVFRDLGPDQADIEMQTSGDIGVSVRWRDFGQVVPWSQIRAARFDTGGAAA